MDEHESLPVQTASVSSVSATSNISLGSLQTLLTKTCGLNENFMLINDIGLNVRPCVELDCRKGVTRMESKLSFSYHGMLYGKFEITGRRPTDILKEESESWRAFKSELRFIATHFCHWHSHPNINRYHGLAILKEEEGGCVPYLLSERVEWNLFSLLEDDKAKLTHRDKVSIVHGITSGLSFLHSRRPRAIVHAALDTGSVLLDVRGNAKLTNFFHAGYVGDPFTVIVVSKSRKNNVEMKLETSLDMSSLGLIIKTIDVDHKNRECVRGSRNVLEKFYSLYSSEGGPPQDFTACEVCRQLAASLDQNPPQQLSVILQRGWVYYARTRLCMAWISWV